MTVTWSILKDGATMKALSLSDSDAALVADYAVNSLRNSVLVSAEQPGTDALFDAQGNVVTPAVPYQPAVYRDPTADEAETMLAEAFFVQLLASATQYHRDQAAQAAAAAITPITPT